MSMWKKSNTCKKKKKKYLVIVFVHLEKDSSMEIAQMLKIKFNDQEERK